MVTETRLEVVETAVAQIPTKLPPGSFQPSWDSLKANYRVPAWFNGAKFDLFLHWGLYSVAAHRNEWCEKHMSGADRQWHL
jgi:alpha-L-fucosidase